MFKQISAVVAIMCVLNPLAARADDWALLGSDLSGNQWFIKNNYVQLQNKEEGIDASFILKGTRKDKPNEEFVAGSWNINCKSGNIYPVEVYARNEADALTMVNSVMVSRKIISEKIVKGVCYSLTPRIEAQDNALPI